MKKAIISFIFILSISVSFISFPSFAKTIPSANTETEIMTKYNDNTPQYQNNAIRWRYKKKNGKLYKRLYNYSTKKWIGKWIQV